MKKEEWKWDTLYRYDIFCLAVFREAEHPRWGLIYSVVVQKDLKSGMEVFAYYGYTREDFPADHPWYWIAKDSEDHENGSP